MLTFKVLTHLLSYPEAEMLAVLDEMAEVIEQESLLTSAGKKALLALIESFNAADLLELQEQYVALFDRGRYLSLHIFEHVHGESRDRGQAMVNLIQMYESHGFELTARELPDYIPLFLEFLSELPPAEVIKLLQDAMPVLSLLGARLNERDSAYQAIFTALESIAGEPEELAEIQQQAATEDSDATVTYMDDIWEEEAVSFMGNGNSCQGQAATAVSPVKITPREEFIRKKETNLSKSMKTAQNYSI